MRNLDLLRTLAVLCVFTAHLTDDLGFKNPGSLGRFGVILFFVHTSFVLMFSLQRLEQSVKVRNRWHLCAVFFIRRFFRIYPLAIFFVLLTVILHVPYDPWEKWYWMGAKTLLANLALVQNVTYRLNVLSVLWSLPLETQMYAMLPFAYFLVTRRKFAAIALWPLSVALALVAIKTSGRLNVFNFGPCFVAGMVAFDLVKKINRKLPAWVFPLALLAIVWISGPLDNIPLELKGKLPLAWFLALAVGLLIAGCQDGKWPGIYPVAHWIAEHSYSIYLCHIPIFWLCINLMHAAPAPLKYGLLAVLSVGMPMVLYRFLEKPLIDIGAQLAARFDKISSPVKIAPVASVATAPR